MQKILSQLCRVFSGGRYRKSGKWSLHVFCEGRRHGGAQLLSNQPEPNFIIHFPVYLELNWFLFGSCKPLHSGHHSAVMLRGFREPLNCATTMLRGVCSQPAARQIPVVFPVWAHTEKYFWSLIKSNWYQIIFTIYR